MSPSPHARTVRRRWIIVGIVVLVLAVWYTNLSQTLNSRKGCQRGRASYALNASNWRIAQQARAAAYADSRKPFDLGAARAYGRNAGGLEQLARTDCNAAYPLPFPLGV